LGNDQTLIPASFSAASFGFLAPQITVTGSLNGSDSIVSVACPATPCSWISSGFTAGDSLIWTSDSGNGGNGPLTLTFSKTVSGAGALIQADGPGQFSARIEVFNGVASSLGTVRTTSDAAGDATYLGVIDKTGPNIGSITISLTKVSNGLTTDFAIDTLSLNKLSAPCDLAITFVSATTGQPVTKTFTVENVGAGCCTGITTVRDPQPTGLAFSGSSVISTSSTGWSCMLNGTTQQCTDSAPLCPGYTANFSFNARVTAPKGRYLLNCATVTNPFDTYSGNNRLCVTILAE